MLGTAAGLALGVVEAVYVIWTAGASFDGAFETGRFAALTAVALAGFGAVAGCAQGVVAAAVGWASAALGDPRRDQLWQARLYTALAVPPVALGCAHIFRGAHARTIAHHDLYAVGIGVGALALWFAGVRAWQRLCRGQLAPGAAGLVAALGAAASLVRYSLDQRVLVRLYPFFHVGLGVMAFGAAELALALVALALGRRLVRLVEPRNAAAIALVAVAAGAASLAAMRTERALGAVVLDRTVVAAPLLRTVGRRGTPAFGGRAATTAGAETAPLPAGPHLGADDVVLITVDAMRADWLTPRTAPSCRRSPPAASPSTAPTRRCRTPRSASRRF